MVAPDWKGYEVAKTLILDPEEWTTDNEMLTPSFKVKLRNLLAKHDDEIKAIAPSPRGPKRGDGEHATNEMVGHSRGGRFLNSVDAPLAKGESQRKIDASGDDASYDIVDDPLFQDPLMTDEAQSTGLQPLLDIILLLRASAPTMHQKNNMEPIIQARIIRPRQWLTFREGLRRRLV